MFATFVMPVFTGGKTSGFNRETFTQALIQSGVPANAAEKCIDRMTRHQDKWLEIIDSSFLPDDLKTSYKELILARLKLITGHVF